MRTLLMIAAVSEAATGLALLVFPPTVVRLLFGTEIAGTGIVVSRVAGIALMSRPVPSYGPQSPGTRF